MSRIKFCSLQRQNVSHSKVLHSIGVGGSADSWQNQLSYFSGLGYEVIAPDLLGHGFSSTPDKVSCYTFPKLFRDVLTVFDHFCVAGGRQNSTVIIGHSYGCSFATAIARSRPDHVKVLVSAIGILT